MISSHQTAFFATAFRSMKRFFYLSALATLALCLTIQGYGQDCNLDFSLGNDTTIDCDATLPLEAPDGYSYDWSTGSTDQMITVSDPGTYSCTISATEQSVVLNGDFQAGETDFGTDYTPGTGGTYGLLSTEGQYALTSDPSNVHNNFASCFDHTFGDATGSMLVVNGASFPDLRVWYQTVTVQPNTDYQFSVWGMSCTSNAPAQLTLVVDGNAIGNVFDLTPITCQWDNHTEIWNSGTNTSVEIAIINQSTLTAGNDFAIDDISFSPICEYTDEIVVSNPAVTAITVPDATSICTGESATLTASSTVAGTTFLWQPGNLTGASITVSPAVTTQYTVSATLPTGCTSAPEAVEVTVISPADFDLGPTRTICQGESTVLGVDIPNVTVLWSTGQTTPQIEVTDQGIYSATVTLNSCSATDQIQLNVIPLPSVSITGSEVLCDGDPGNLQATPGNYSYLWNTGETGSAISINQSGNYSVTATDQQTGCASEVSFHVNSLPPPVLSLSDTIQLCTGKSKTVLAFGGNNSEIVWDDGTEGSSYEISQPGIYSATATNACGSISRSVQVVGVDCTETLFVPNSFTPNGDGVNDIFKAVGRRIKTFKIDIYDRWGRQVFTSNDLDVGWNGSFAGNSYFVPDGVYSWIAVLEYPDGNVETKKGFVQVIR